MTSFPRVLKKRLATMRVKRIPKGQILIYEGDHPADVFLVKSGVVKVHDIDSAGNEKILHLLDESSIMPFNTFSQDPDMPTRWYYTTLTDCELWVISKKELHELICNHSELSMYFIQWFFEEMHELLIRIDSMGKTNVRDKLIAALKFLMAHHCFRSKTGRWFKVKFPVNHQLIADIIGMTRESTSIAMKELSDKGVVRYQKTTRLEINKKKLLNLETVV